MARTLSNNKWSCRIITPYHNQQVLLTRMLELVKERGCLSQEDITVEIVESMQGAHSLSLSFWQKFTLLLGGECDVTILSLVKPAKGRDAMANRINVALSRAKHQSIVVVWCLPACNPSLIQTDGICPRSPSSSVRYFILFISFFTDGPCRLRRRRAVLQADPRL